MTAIKGKISDAVPSKNATDATSELVRRRPWRLYADVGDHEEHDVDDKEAIRLRRPQSFLQPPEFR